MKTYKGHRCGHAADVTVNGKPLDPRLDLWNHSPTGFQWGYGGSGPAQLALALLADYLGDDEQAVALCKLSPRLRLSPRYREKFEAVGWQFGRSVLVILHCPSCPANARPDPNKSVMKATIAEMLGDDEDGIAATFEDHGL